MDRRRRLRLARGHGRSREHARPRLGGSARPTRWRHREERPEGRSRGLVVGLILGATLTLAVQSRGEQVFDALVDTPDAPTPAQTQPEAPATFLAWVPGGLPPGFTRAVAGLPAIDRVTSVAEDNVWMTQVVVVGRRARRSPGSAVRTADRRRGRHRLGRSARSCRRRIERWSRRWRTAKACLGATSAALRGLGPGAELAFQGGARIRIADVLPDELVGAAELLVSKETGESIGVHRERYLLLQPRDGGSVTSTELRARLRPLLPADLGIYRRVQVRAPGRDAVLPFRRRGVAAGDDQDVVRRVRRAAVTGTSGLPGHRSRLGADAHRHRDACRCWGASRATGRSSRSSATRCRHSIAVASAG